MSTNIYILRLKGGKYYVGKTDNILKRYDEHVAGKGSSWTRKYKPIGIEKTISNASVFDEDRYTKEYMSKYGIENVRGGSYVQVELDDVQMDALKTEIWGAKDACTRCGRKGHFVKDCYARSDVSGNEIEEEEEVWVCEKCDQEFDTYHECEQHERRCGSYSSGACYRCGRTGHLVADCFAQSHISGRYIRDADHRDETVACFKCGTPGHYSTQCYSRRYY